MVHIMCETYYKKIGFQPSGICCITGKVVPSVSKKRQEPLASNTVQHSKTAEFVITPLGTPGIVSGFLQYNADLLHDQKYKRFCQLMQLFLWSIQ